MYEDKIKKLFEKIGENVLLPLATNDGEGNVSVRTVSAIIINQKIYFQTDVKMKKAKDIASNHCVAVCIEGIQMQGECVEIGRVSDNPFFEELYMHYYPGAYEKYSNLEDERVFEITPKYIKCWSYIENKPVYEIYDVDKCLYEIKPY